MLVVKTLKNPLVSNPEKDGYCFKSSCNQTLTEKELAAAMADYNSSFTEADNTGMLSILNAVVVNYLAKGYSIELPFGTLRPNATGTCASIQDSFSLGTGNNRLNFLFSANSKSLKHIKANLNYMQIPPDSTKEAKIYRLSSLKDDASEDSELTLSAGKILRLHGRNLSFDIDDLSQGVFFENENGRIRMECYIRRGTNVIDVAVPLNAEAGDYSVTVVTKPGKTYFTAFIDSIVKVTA